jgi:O-antigen/teichoic acid export membrane protein
VVVVFAPEIILIADARFHDAWRVIPLVVAAYFFNGLVPILEVGMNLKNRMHYLAAIFIGGAILNVTLNLVFVPRYGMMAAAGTTLATYLVLPVVVYVVSSRLFPLRLEWSRLARVAGVYIAAGAGAALLSPASLWVAVVAKAALCVATLPALWLIGFFTEEELGKVKGMFRPERA